MNVLPTEGPYPSAELLRRVQADSETAADVLFARYVERLTRLARSRLAAELAARVDPEDIVQSAYRSFFVAARQGRFTVSESGDLWRLLVEVTLHKLYRQAARHKAARRSVRRDRPSSDDSIWQRVAGTEPTPEQAAIAAEELEALLKKLPPQGREVVALALQGHQQREIAVKLGVADRTVRRWLKAARAALATESTGSAAPLAGRPIATPPKRSVRPKLALPVKSRAVSKQADLKWSDYLLHEQIGAGSTGKIYRALERSTGRLVAVKFLRKALLREASVVERFLRESQTVQALGHPQIVGIQGAGRTPGDGWFLVMQLVNGRDLHSITQHQSIAAGQAAEWIAAAARIVQSAHDRGIIHCDLKPGNLLLDTQNAVWVTDFGLAIRMAEEAPYALLAGTPAFMAPEQVDPCWGQISPRTDVWGLGATLFYLLYGRPPHAGRDVAETLGRVVAGKAVEFPGRRKGMSSHHIEACRRCLMKRPEDRFASAAEMAAALDRPMGVRTTALIAAQRADL
jgi:RNA polymerase sigma factor (sigma-70 family)